MAPAGPRLVPVAGIAIVVLGAVWFAGTAVILQEASLEERLRVTGLDFLPWLAIWLAAATLAWRFAPRRVRWWHLIVLLAVALALVVTRIGFLHWAVDVFDVSSQPFLLLLQLPWHVTFISAAAAAGAAARLIVGERAEAARLAALEAAVETDRVQRLQEELDPDGLMASLGTIEAELRSDLSRADAHLLALSARLRAQLRRPPGPDSVVPRRHAGRGPAGSVGPGEARNASPPDLLPWIITYSAVIALIAFGRDLVALRMGMAEGLTRGVPAALVWLAACLGALVVVGDRRLRHYLDLAALLAAAALLAVVVLLAQNLFSCYPLLRATCTPSDRLAFGTLVFPLTYATVLSFFSLGLAVNHAREWRAVELRAAVVGAERTRAQATALAAQLRPHFLFNTLQSALTLAHRDREAAASMVARLRALFGHSLQIVESVMVPFVHEVAMIQAYLDIERVRFQDRLDASFTIDPAVHDADVPPFLLQPIVENAIHHAVAVRGRGWVRIDARPVDEGRRIRIVVSDSGGGSGPPRTGGSGVGLGATTARLRALYDEGYDLDVQTGAGSGTTVTIALPRDWTEWTEDGVDQRPNSSRTRRA